MRKWIRTLAAIIGVLFAAAAGYWLVGFVSEQVEYKRYPVAYAAEIRAYAEEYRLNPYLVIAVVRCESSFNPNAVSSAGAVGLMQIMPSTGQWIAETLEMTDAYAEQLLYEPDTNLRFGCWYLRYLADLYDGDLMQIVCAYNAGQGTVGEWLRDPAYSADGKLTAIPYESTATYYERVLTALNRYAALYPTLFTDGAAQVAAPAGA